MTLRTDPNVLKVIARQFAMMLTVDMFFRKARRVLAETKLQAYVRCRGRAPT